MKKTTRKARAPKTKFTVIDPKDIQYISPWAAASWYAVTNLGGPFASYSKLDTQGGHVALSNKPGFSVVPLSTKGALFIYNREYQAIAEHEKALPEERKVWLTDILKELNGRLTLKTFHRDGLLKDLGLTLAKYVCPFCGDSLMVGQMQDAHETATINPVTGKVSSSLDSNGGGHSDIELECMSGCRGIEEHFTKEEKQAFVDGFNEAT